MATRSIGRSELNNLALTTVSELVSRLGLVVDARAGAVSVRLGAVSIDGRIVTDPFETVLPQSCRQSS